ncbi:hypothetical protein VKT23_011982 [Stygiomarasmius scandens]|uniref:Major facilitator superfamily (MFS) profile domain-containing protein n=1 Tax=Marasmiellus scandens TaxID=2682957 RepID=A0ABR1JA59_9AGAR
MSLQTSFDVEKELKADLPTLCRPQSERTLTPDSFDTTTKSIEVDVENPKFPDGGLKAWSVALGCFMLGCSCLGWGMVWGVLQDYYHTTMFPNTSLTVLSTIIGLANFMSNGSAYLFGVLGDRYGYKKMIALSCMIIYLCQLASAFSTKIYQLFLFQGFFNGVGIGMGMPLYISLLSQWFDKKRGLATGLTVSGTGIGGSVQVLILRPLITALGFRKALLIHSSINAMVCITAWVLISERIPRNPNARKVWMPRKVTGSFYSIAASMLVGVFGYLTPYYFSTTYTHFIVPSIESSSMKSTVPLIVMNLCLCASLFGLEGLSSITGFMFLATSPGQFTGALLSSAILSSSGNNWTAVAMYSGGMQILGAACILYGETISCLQDFTLN